MRSLDRINGYGHVALRYGLEEAIFLDSLMFWYKENRANDRNYQDGRWWTYNSVSALSQIFPWWSAKQLRRITESCREKGAVLAENYNEDRKDRTLWYTPSDELLDLYGMSAEGNCIGPNGQTHLPKQADTVAQTGKTNIEHVKTNVDTHEDNPLPPKEDGVLPQGSTILRRGHRVPVQDLIERDPSMGSCSITGAAQGPGADGVRPQGSERAAQGPEKSSDEVLAVFDEYAGEDGELRERLEEFQEFRKRKKKPLQTRRAAMILTGKLDKLSSGDRDRKLALLDNAILHGWDSVYPLKEDEAPPAAPPPGRGWAADPEVY